MLLACGSQEDAAHLSALFRKQKLKVDLATEGLEALQLLRTTLYSCAFIAQSASGLDGCVCIERFRRWEEAHRSDVGRQFVVGLIDHDSIIESMQDAMITAGADQAIPALALRGGLERGQFGTGYR